MGVKTEAGSARYTISSRKISMGESEKRFVKNCMGTKTEICTVYCADG